MKKFFLILSSLIITLSACGQAAGPVSTSTPEVTVGLPDTWTPAPTGIPSSTPSPTPTLIPSQTPLPSSPPDPALTQTQPAEQTLEPGVKPDSVRLEELVPGQELELSRIMMVSPERGWAVGTGQDPYPRILMTEDGGRTWRDRTPCTAFKALDRVSADSTLAYFHSNSTAWVYFQHQDRGDDPGVHRVWRTSDGGQSWDPSTPLPFSREMRYFTGELVFINSRVGWLRTFSEIAHMNDYAYLFQTTNGGETWTLVNQPGDSMLELLVNSQLGFADPQQGWILKDSLGGFQPFLEITSNGGWTWKRVLLPGPEGGWDSPEDRCRGSDPHFLGGAEGVFLLNCAPIGVELNSGNPQMSSYLYRSGDLGQTWTLQQLPAPVDQLVFLDDDQGFALGREHYRTDDGGQSWEKIKTVQWMGEFSWISPLEAWAVAREGDETALVHTRDGGESYQLIEPSAAEQ